MPTGSDGLPLGLAEQGAPHGRLPRDVARGTVAFVDANDPVGRFVTVLVLDGDGGAEEDAIDLGLDARAEA